MHLKLCSLQRLWLCVNALIKSPKPCNLSPSPREPSGSNSEIISLSISVDNVPDQHKPTLVEMWSFYTQCKLCTSTNTSPKSSQVNLAVHGRGTGTLPDEQVSLRLWHTSHQESSFSILRHVLGAQAEWYHMCVFHCPSWQIKTLLCDPMRMVTCPYTC